VKTNFLDNSNRSENGWPAFVQAADLPIGDYELFRRCTHCGLCTSSCPTFVELGDETTAPRGRIQIMRMAADGRCELTPRMRRHLDLCSIAGLRNGLSIGRRVRRMIEPFAWP